MKSLPEEFPIRYALLVSDSFDKEEIMDDFDLAQKNALWSQFISLIKSKPLGLEDLSIRYSSLGYSDTDDNRLLVIPKLNGAQDWPDELKKKLETMIPHGLYSMTHGFAFSLTLYSYKGMAEMPLSLRVLNGADKQKIMTELQLRELNYSSLDGLRVAVKKKYDAVIKGKAGLWQKYSHLNEPLVFYIDIPYSKLWELLDQGKNNGIACFNGDIEAVENGTGKADIDPNKIITVAVARNLEALMFEELISLYKVSNFCRCCHKPLPFAYQGSYCPDIKENTDCKRKRERIRKKSSSK